MTVGGGRRAAVGEAATCERGGSGPLAFGLGPRRAAVLVGARWTRQGATNTRCVVVVVVVVGIN